MTTLAQSRAALWQKEARLLQKMRAAEKRQDYAIGKLAREVGLSALDMPALRGAFLSVKADAAKPNIVARWREAGVAALAPEDEGRETVVVTFPSGVKRTPALYGLLKGVHLRHNKILGHFEGRVDFAEAEAVVLANGGTIRRVNSEAAVPLRDAAE